MHLQSTTLALALAASLAACGKHDAPKAAAPHAPASGVAGTKPPPAPAPEAPTANASRELAVADIDRWQRGMDAEKKQVQEAGARLAAAKDDPAAKIEALNASLEMSTVAGGAAAAGVDVEAYRRIRSELSDAVAQLDPLELEMDVRTMPPQMVAQFRQAREQNAAQLASRLPPDLLAALSARASQLRQQDKDLAAERMKVANAAR